MSVTAAAGFLAGGICAGIKADGARDLALVTADHACPTAAVFTSSLAAAAPVQVSRAHIASGRARAVVLNSGCANAGTGAAGVSAANAMCERVGVELGVQPTEVLVCSTGPIGTRLPDDLPDRVPGVVAALSVDGSAAAEAILTTDSRSKEAAATLDGGWTVGGMAKGAGMLRPDMATMLAVLTTDAVVDRARVGSMLRRAVDLTFNSLNVDGCQSTNDTVILMSSGVSEITPDHDEFEEALTAVCRQLAWQMAEDAEGASRVVTIEVLGAANDGDARTLGKAMADSALVRSSFYGGDPNWGRLLAAAGVAGVGFDPNAFDVSYQGVDVARNGMALDHDEAAILELMDGDLEVTVRVGPGSGEALIVTTDLTPAYVELNGERS